MLNSRSALNLMPRCWTLGQQLKTSYPRCFLTRPSMWRLKLQLTRSFNLRPKYRGIRIYQIPILNRKLYRFLLQRGNVESQISVCSFICKKKVEIMRLRWLSFIELMMNTNCRKTNGLFCLWNLIYIHTSFMNNSGLLFVH